MSDGLQSMGLQRVGHDLLIKQQQPQHTQIPLKSKQIEAALKLFFATL